MMEKIKTMYGRGFDYFKNLSEKIKSNKQYKTTFILVVALVVLGGIFFYQVYGSKTTKSDLENTLDRGSALLQEAKAAKTDRLAGKTTEEDFQKKSEEIGLELENINIDLHAAELAGNVKITKETLDSAGDALQVLAYLIFTSKDLNNLNDEILALDIILEDIKSEI